jgi:hypothetical protein
VVEGNNLNKELLSVGPMGKYIITGGKGGSKCKDALLSIVVNHSLQLSSILCLGGGGLTCINNITILSNYTQVIYFKCRFN